MSLAGQRVLVTGASSGIGAETAVAFAEAGAVVGLCARREDRLREVAARCREHTPGAVPLTVDLADLDAIDGFARSVLDELGGVDILVNNAGVPKRRRALDLTPQDVEAVMALNYYSPVRLTLALLPHMVERGSGHVVNVSSMGVHVVAFGVGAYAASKAALELFTESLYAELSPTGVQAHLVVPGTTRSEFADDKPGNDAARRLDPEAYTSPRVVAEAIVASIGDERFVTYATASDEATSANKHADSNAFLAHIRTLLR